MDNKYSTLNKIWNPGEIPAKKSQFNLLGFKLPTIDNKNFSYRVIYGLFGETPERSAITQKLGGKQKPEMFDIYGAIEYAANMNSEYRDNSLPRCIVPNFSNFYLVFYSSDIGEVLLNISEEKQFEFAKKILDGYKSHSSGYISIVGIQKLYGKICKKDKLKIENCKLFISFCIPGTEKLLMIYEY